MGFSWIPFLAVIHCTQRVVHRQALKQRIQESRPVKSEYPRTNNNVRYVNSHNIFLCMLSDHSYIHLSCCVSTYLPIQTTPVHPVLLHTSTIFPLRTCQYVCMSRGLFPFQFLSLSIHDLKRMLCQPDMKQNSANFVFRRVRNIAKSDSQLRRIGLHRTTRLSVDGFWRNFIFGYFFENLLREDSSFFKIWK